MSRGCAGTAQKQSLRSRRTPRLRFGSHSRYVQKTAEEKRTAKRSQLRLRGAGMCGHSSPDDCTHVPTFPGYAEKAYQWLLPLCRRARAQRQRSAVNNPLKGVADWRIDNAKWTRNAELRFKKYLQPMATWDHDHCEGCWVRFMESGPPAHSRRARHRRRSLDLPRVLPRAQRSDGMDAGLNRFQSSLRHESSPNQPINRKAKHDDPSIQKKLAKDPEYKSKDGGRLASSG